MLGLEICVHINDRIHYSYVIRYRQSGCIIACHDPAGQSGQGGESKGGLCRARIHILVIKNYELW